MPLSTINRENYRQFPLRKHWPFVQPMSGRWAKGHFKGNRQFASNGGSENATSVRALNLRQK